MKAKFMSVLVFASMISSAFAGLPTGADGFPVYLPVSSSKALLAYAKGEVGIGTVDGGSQDITIPGGTTWGMVMTDASRYGSITNMLGMLRSIQLDYDVVDPKAPVYTYTGLRDTNWYTFFWSFKQTNLEYVAGSGWHLPVGAEHMPVELELNSVVPIQISGAVYAYSRSWDQNGNPQYDQVQTDQGYIYFPTNMTGKIGQLVVYRNDGKGAVYDISGGGKKVSGFNVQLTVDPTLKGVVSLADPVAVEAHPVSVNGQGTCPLYEVTITSARLVRFYAETSEGEVADGMWARYAGGNWVYIPFQQIGHTSTFQLSAGTYEIYFYFPSFDQDGLWNDQNNYGGDKG
jgi:hypothetical protein